MTGAIATVTVSSRRRATSRARIVGRHACVFAPGQAPTGADGSVDRAALLDQARAIFLGDVGMTTRDFAEGGRYRADWDVDGAGGLDGIDEGNLH